MQRRLGNADQSNPQGIHRHFLACTSLSYFHHMRRVLALELWDCKPHVRSRWVSKDVHQFPICTAFHDPRYIAVWVVLASSSPLFVPPVPDSARHGRNEFCTLDFPRPSSDRNCPKIRTASHSRWNDNRIPCTCSFPGIHVEIPIPMKWLYSSECNLARWKFPSLYQHFEYQFHSLRPLVFRPRTSEGSHLSYQLAHPTLDGRRENC
mmetsp:Transcript_1406/g.2958  ORF Transcript_1406/g.2958 Transcript_1406/m.2958 type:complete len:207 (-) Transcript_1406:618-1238(-)